METEIGTKMVFVSVGVSFRQPHKTGRQFQRHTWQPVSEHI